MKQEIPYRYAKALFFLSAEKIELRDQMLLQMGLWYRKIPQFKQFFLNPQITSLQKKELLEKIGTDSAITDFTLLLLEKGKFSFLPQIADQFHRLALNQKNVLEAELITAHPIQPVLQQKILDQITSAYPAFQIDFKAKIEPKIIGGSILMIGHQILDFSIKGRLEQLRKNLLEEVG